MRLDRLDLTRYGKFTDQAVEFGPAQTPDLHVIHGPNEAGKSTLLSAWLDFLFRMPDRSAMNFLHDYKSMQVGAALSIGGKPHALTRVKKRDGSLLDSTGAPVPEALLSGALFGMDRAAYGAMFSLNRQTLEEGGESILASEGDLGELLFQASAGLSDLSAQLAGFDAESQAFLSTSGRKGQLRDLGKDLADLDARIKALDTQAAGFAKLTAARDAAETDWRAAQEALEAATRQRIALEALRAGQRTAAHLNRLDAEITGFGELKDPPADWLRDAEALDRAETELRAHLAAAEGAVAGLEQDLAKQPEDAEILALAQAIEAAEALKPAHDTALTDLPKRQRERDTDGARMADCLRRLGRPGAAPTALLPETAVLTRLRGLVEAHGAVHGAYRTAVTERTRAEALRDRAEARLAEAGGAVAEAGELRGLVATLRADDPRGAADRAQAALDGAEGALQAALAALAPWTGTAAEMTALTCPTREAVADLGARLEAALRAQELAAAELARCEEAVAERKSARAGLELEGSASAADAGQARTRREAAWAEHRARLDAESADAFEQAMRLDDRVTATLAARTAQADRAREADAAVTRAEAQLASAQTDLAGAEAELEARRDDLAAAVRGISAALPEEMGAQALEGWLDRLAAARAALLARDDAARDRARLLALVERARGEVLAALERAGRGLPADTGLSPALAAAQALVEDAAELKGLAEQVRQARDAVSERKRMEEEATTALDSWQDDWAAALKGTAWADPLPDVGEMRGVLEELSELREVLGRIHDLDHRIDTMAENQAQFVTEATALAERAGMETDLPVNTLWARLASRLRDAQEGAARRADVRNRLATAREALDALTRKSAGHQARVAQVCDFFGLDDWAAARDALREAGRRAELVRDRAERAVDLCNTLGEETVEAALARLDGADATEIAARIERLSEEVKPLQTAQETAHAAFRDAEAALAAVGGDGAVARLEEARQTCLVEIEEGARAHLRARLGLLAVEDALRRYRDNHRSGMMTRASEAFATMTGGAYSGLTTQAEGNREVLVALPAAGGSKQATQLSEGTRAQLYLALRIAGYHEFAAQNGPVPFIADDIMESFDDDRARATFGLLAEMSGLGQVIYLTHHSHMRDLAQEACDGVRVHELR
ncbi:AAA family ATPase [Aliiroseovarius sp.]|uniref:ATP-binding protein n=1 Tax=Aliiroseovarius sp. TaxID=1872442 RepID=UPI003BAC66F5